MRGHTRYNKATRCPSSASIMTGQQASMACQQRCHVTPPVAATGCQPGAAFQISRRAGQGGADLRHWHGHGYHRQQVPRRVRSSGGECCSSRQCSGHQQRKRAHNGWHHLEGEPCACKHTAAVRDMHNTFCAYVAKTTGPAPLIASIPPFVIDPAADFPLCRLKMPLLLSTSGCQPSSRRGTRSTR